MDESLFIAFELSFNILYLITIWAIVIFMYVRKANLHASSYREGILFLWSFFLLAVGDSGHVGFRVFAIAFGGLESNPVLVGLGALVTAITLTFFYMIFVEIWRVRFQKNRGTIWYLLMILGIIRCFIMIPSGNEWTSVVPPFDWSLARNVPLTILGIVVALLMLKSAQRTNDSLFKKLSYMIFLSYACYLPVILFVQKVPMIGMLMIPKTLAYITMAIFVSGLFKKRRIKS